MAKATRKTKTVEKVVTETVNDGVLLELTDEEAQILAQIFHHIGGPRTGHRGKTDKMSEALKSLGFIPARYPNSGGIDTSMGHNAIYFV